MNIVDGSELSGDLLLQTVRKRVRNLVQDVVCRCHGCKRVELAHVPPQKGSRVFRLTGRNQARNNEAVDVAGA